MQKLKVLLAAVLVGIGAALTYHVFENLVHGAIDLIWYDIFDTDDSRIWVLPLTVGLTLIYFGIQHMLDKKSENHEEHGLGNMPEPTLSNFLKILFIGFFSLIAGASLGPEAVLVPACMVLGAIIGVKLFSSKRATQLMAVAGLIALFTAFFHSFLIGVLSLALIKKQTGEKLRPIVIIVGVIAALSSYITLQLVSGEPLLEMPHYNWHLNWGTIAGSIVLIGAGFALNHGMDHLGKLFEKLKSFVSKTAWWQHALVAGLVLAGLFLIGGPLVEFTGNHSIQPMFAQARTLGFVGLLWILIVKMAAITWSKTIGYRGGMVFPTIFLAAVLVAMMQIFVADFNLIYGMIAVLIGAFVADAKTRVLV